MFDNSETKPTTDETEITSEISRSQNITKTKLFEMLLQTMSTGLD